MKDKMKQAHMRAAYAYAQTSYCERRQVGCIVVRELENGLDNVVSIGYNGTPPGEPNICENEEGLTIPSVIHAESNALDKLNYQAQGMHLFCTLEPCYGCAELIIDSGVTHVYYCEEYSCHDGLQHLFDNDIVVERIQLT